MIGKTIILGAEKIVNGAAAATVSYAEADLLIVLLSMPLGKSILS
jgi:hypothetical protein